MSSDVVATVEQYDAALHRLLEQAAHVNKTRGVDSLAHDEIVIQIIEDIRRLSPPSNSRGYAAIETACRATFYNQIAFTPIDSAEFSQVWDLLDIVSILSDLELCEPGLVFWLVEELLDCQPIEGCKIVFDYLEARRERLTIKHFKQKNLIILRACNELLRRLSRAEDTVFCGRVFIFLFQSFPLGDRSSVNLRGKYHTENVTNYERKSDVSTPERGEGGMSVDEMEVSKVTPQDGGPLDAAKNRDLASNQSKSAANTPKNLPNSEGERAPIPEVSMDDFYEILWSMQEFFSHPTSLFVESVLKDFKSALDITLAKFKAIDQTRQTIVRPRLSTVAARLTKRKRRDSPESALTSSFSPKYLTSRELFGLELNDLSFRRHVLVQALILLDFLLSLTPTAKRKLAATTNTSVLYNFSLDQESSKWATSARNEISTYLQQGPEGKFYFRMVDTVLSRDKNWAYWKAEGCPPIARAPVSAEVQAEMQGAVNKACANKRIRPSPMSAVDFKFLDIKADVHKDDAVDGTIKHIDKMPELCSLREPARFSLPDTATFKRPIEDSQFEIEMARDDDEKQAAIDTKASQLWRMLRIACRRSFKAFDLLEDGNNLAPLFDDGSSDLPTDVQITESSEVHQVETESSPQAQASETDDASITPPQQLDIPTEEPTKIEPNDTKEEGLTVETRLEANVPAPQEVEAQEQDEVIVDEQDDTPVTEAQAPMEGTTSMEIDTL